MKDGMGSVGTAPRLKIVEGLADLALCGDFEIKSAAFSDPGMQEAMKFIFPPPRYRLTFVRADRDTTCMRLEIGEPKGRVTHRNDTAQAAENSGSSKPPPACSPCSFDPSSPESK